VAQIVLPSRSNLAQRDAKAFQGDFVLHFPVGNEPTF
jgi:hypothetical protein